MPPKRRAARKRKNKLASPTSEGQEQEEELDMDLDNVGSDSDNNNNNSQSLSPDGEMSGDSLPTTRSRKTKQTRQSAKTASRKQPSRGMSTRGKGKTAETAESQEEEDNSEAVSTPTPTRRHGRQAIKKRAAKLKIDDSEDEEMEDEIDEVENNNEELPEATAKPSKSGKGKGRGRGGKVRGGRKRTIATTEGGDEEESGEVNIDSMSEEDFGDGDGGSTTTSLANLTRRQRAKLTKDYGEELMELPTRTKRQKASAEENALRKSEHARRRKFQSEQRAEQLKADTINRILNKQTSKGRNKVGEESETASAIAEAAEPNPGMARYIQRTYREKKSSPALHVRSTLSLPRGIDIQAVFPSVAQDGKQELPSPIAVAIPQICSVDGCEQGRKYKVNSQVACCLEHWRLLSAVEKT